VKTEVCALEDALKTGATAVFDEKYGATVRIVKMGEMSMELCGGTHVKRTGDIGFLKVVHESAIAAGVRRIEAVTGSEALTRIQRAEEELKRTAGLFKAGQMEVYDRAERLLRHTKELEKEIEALKGKLAAKDSGDLISQAEEINGVKVLAVEVSIADVKTLRDFGDKLRDKLASGIILLGSKAGEKVMLLCMVTKDLAGKYHAGNIIKELAPLVGGSGGQRELGNAAHGGGTRRRAIRAGLPGGGCGVVGQAQHCGQAAQLSVGIGRGGQVPHMRGRQAGCNAQEAMHGLVAAAQQGCIRVGDQQAFLGRNHDLRVEHGDLADDDVGLLKLAAEFCVGGAGLREKQVPHLQTGSFFAQLLGQLRQHRPRPGPGADLLQAALVDVDDGDGIRRCLRRQQGRDSVVPVVIGLAQGAQGHEPRSKRGQKDQPERQGPAPLAAQRARGICSAHFLVQSVRPLYTPVGAFSWKR
jgi:hypothetical protein